MQSKSFFILKNLVVSATVGVSFSANVEAGLAEVGVVAIDAPSTVTVGQTFQVVTTIEKPSFALNNSARLRFFESPSPGANLISFVQNLSTTGGLDTPSYIDVGGYGELEWGADSVADGGMVMSIDEFTADAVGIMVFDNAAQGPVEVTMEILPVPEPGTYAMLGSSLVIVALKRKRRIDSLSSVCTMLR